MENILAVPKVIPALLKVFTEFNIHATFATVGLLFAADKKELLAYSPELKPEYENLDSSPYTNEFALLGENEETDSLHYADSLVRMIQNTPDQEIGSHTFCHYYCLEAGQTVRAFEADMKAAVAIAKRKGITLKSLVFPRNQFNGEYLNVLKELGFTSFRGNELSWLYAAKSWKSQSTWKRMGRLLDSYMNVSGHNIYKWEDLKKSAPLYNIPASRFLRPYNPMLSKLEDLRLKRILNDMTEAAKTGCVYHLWWHPHNFGAHTEQNIQFLRAILVHYQKLQQQYSFESLTMSEVVAKIERSIL
jgi:peptidoglycan/xylan/chitin deacetylase (PgdA/CDA1 family)